MPRSREEAKHNRCPLCYRLYEGDFCVRCSEVAWKYLSKPGEKFLPEYAKAAWQFLAEPVRECRARASWREPSSGLCLI